MIKKRGWGSKARHQYDAKNNAGCGRLLLVKRKYWEKETTGKDLKTTRSVFFTGWCFLQLWESFNKRILFLFAQCALKTYKATGHHYHLN